MNDNQSLVPPSPKLPEPAHPSAVSVLDLQARDFDSSNYLQTYWNIISKHRWTIMTITVIVTVLVAIASFRATPIYEATVHLDIEADTPQIQSLNDLFRDEMFSDQEFIGTQIQVLQGEILAQRTIEQLELTKSPAAVAALQGEREVPQSPKPVTSEQLLGTFKGNLRVVNVRDSHVVTVTFESANPELSAKVANALGDNYIEYSFRQKYDATRQAAGWMEQQLDELKAKVEKSQQALVDYERQNAIVNVNDKQSVVDQRLADLSHDLTEAQSDRLQKESLYELVRDNESQVAFVAQDELLQKLDGNYADLKSQYADAVQQYGPKHPKAQRLQSQVDEVQSLITRERTRLVERIKNDYNAALGRERLLTAAVAKEKTEVGALNQLLIQHNILQREFQTNQTLYDSLQQRLKDATVSAGLRATNIHVIDPARVPKGPVRPQKTRNIAIGFMVGMVLAIAFVFLKEILDTSVKSIDEAERYAQAPALAVVPHGRFLVARRALSFAKTNGNGNSFAAEQLAILNRPMSPLAESFRTLLTSVVLSTAPQPPQMLLITSSTSSEGKTLTSLNLSIALAQRGESTLLIDADMRHPGIARALGVGNNKGLSSLLTGQHRLDEVLQPYPSVDALTVLPAGPRPPNPAQLLSSPAMQALLQDLRQRFKSVVIDSPPLLPVTDSIMLSTLVDGVIFVVESGKTVRAAVSRARKILQNVNAHVLGLVLNKVDVRFDGYYGYYNHYYYHHSDDAQDGAAKTEALSIRPPV
jgi:capsular exopolysaccharide synthesis family protein